MPLSLEKLHLDNFKIAFPNGVVFATGLVVGILGGILIYFALLLIKNFKEKIKVNLSLNYTLLLVEIPKPIYKQDAQLKVAEEINNFENFLATINKVKQTVIFEIATSHTGEEIFFYVAVPKKYTEAFQKTIKSFWSGSEVYVAKEDYNVFNPEGSAIGSYITTKSHYFKPIKTYKEISIGDIDTLDSFLAAFSKLAKEGEGLAYQIIIKPLSTKINKKISSIVKKLKQGKSFDEAMGGTGKQIVENLQKSSSPEAKAEQQREEAKPKTIDEILIKSLEAKMTKPFFDVNIRIVASGKEFVLADQILSTIESAFGQFVNPGMNEFQIHRVKGRGLRDLIYRFSFRLFEKRYKSILNSEEVASIFHFPTSRVKSPIVHYLASRSAPPPVNLSQTGVVLGESLYQGQSSEIKITKEDRRRHIYVVGQTGVGKTVLLKNIIEQDIKNGDGVCFIDPHGDVAQEILGLIPQTRIDDVIYFNPGDPQKPMALNILEYDINFPEQKTFIINTLIEIIDKLYNLQVTGGPMFEQYLRNSLLLIMDDPTAGYTLMDVSRVFVDKNFRKELTDKCKNYPVVEFWIKQSPAVGGEMSMENMTTWITSKLNPFITNDFVRPIIAQSKSTLNFRDIMDNKKILIVNLSKGKIGEISAYLLGMILVAKILAAAFGRVDTPEEQRKDFYLFIDEFQNLAFKSIASILSEARKYRLSMVLAHQYIKQLPEEIASAVFGNVGTIMSFRIGTEDAEVLEKQFTPVFTKTDLVNIPNYSAYLKILINGHISEPFNIKTLEPNETNPALAQRLIELSSLKFGKPLAEIEEQIRQKYQPTIPAPVQLDNQNTTI
ncbi:MAG: DUF87 domain-containing protein [Patescibacteria group bacterium]